MIDEHDVPVITIDGPSGTGKGTVCHRVAQHLGWHSLDSGSIYRVLALAAQREQLTLDNLDLLCELAIHLPLSFDDNDIMLNDERVNALIRTEQCGHSASQMAAIPEIRHALLIRQRAFATVPGLVTDGRDMGTVVFPGAMLKIYLSASAEIRAERRYLQLKNSGKSDTLAHIAQALAIRDARDMAREHAPLKPADDAVVIDTTVLLVQDVVDKVLHEARLRHVW